MSQHRSPSNQNFRSTPQIPLTQPNVNCQRQNEIQKLSNFSKSLNEKIKQKCHLTIHTKYPPTLNTTSSRATTSRIGGQGRVPNNHTIAQELQRQAPLFAPQINSNREANPSNTIENPESGSACSHQHKSTQTTQSHKQCQ